MKKILPFWLAAIMVLALTGCGGIDASNKAVSIGKQALTAVDEYLDGESEYFNVKDRLDECYDELEYADDLPIDEKADWYIRVDILNMSAYLNSDHYDGNAETYDKLIESRNSLAEDLGEKTR